MDKDEIYIRTGKRGKLPVLRSVRRWCCSSTNKLRKNIASAFFLLATAEAGASRLAVARQVAAGDSGLLVDSLARADSEAAPREPCTAPSSGEADDTEVETERQATAERMRMLH